jgi:hypothetical protein
MWYTQKPLEANSEAKLYTEKEKILYKGTKQILYMLGMGVHNR